MQDKQTVLLFLEIFVIVIFLGLLSAVALPHAGQMLRESKAVSREAELVDIQTAVTKMLDDSTAGRLESVGPIADMSLVHTCDTPPLVLMDYLRNKKDISIKSGCVYSFASDGTVLQIAH